MLVVKEISCKSILNPSNLGGEIKYCINPYVGCQHGCLYCYAAFMRKHTEHREGWGEFVDPKINAPMLLAKELLRKPKGLVFISSVTDAYQPLERRYELTRHCLEHLLRHKYPVEILTKSSLVTRDTDLFAKFPSCEVGFTITTTDDNARKEFEPSSSPVDERFAALEQLSDHGVRTWIFLGPILPYITDRDGGLEDLIQRASQAKVGHILIDRLNVKPDMKPRFVTFMRERYPDLFPEYERILFSSNTYFQECKSRILDICRKRGIRAEACF